MVHSKRSAGITPRMVVDQPLILIPGVRKCGTTTLFAALSRHSRVVGPVVKEPQFFALKRSQIDAHLEWYPTLFPEADAERWLLDGSTLGLANTEAAHTLAEFCPEAHVVLMVRDPARRAYSAYLHMVRQVSTWAERRPYEELLDGLEAAYRSQGIVESERRLLNEAVAEGSVNPNYYTSSFHPERFGAPFSSEFADPLSGYRYFEESSYSRFVQTYADVFGERFHLIAFEQLTTTPSDTIEGLLATIGLPIEQAVLDLPHENKARVPKNAFARKVLELRNQNRFMRGVAEASRSGPMKKIQQAVKRQVWGAKPRLPVELLERTRALLADEYAWWAEYNPTIYKHWSA
ncbi:MAG: sulfotransferase [Pseudomonadota bacterium]